MEGFYMILGNASEWLDLMISCRYLRCFHSHRNSPLSPL